MLLLCVTFVFSPLIEADFKLDVLHGIACHKACRGCTGPSAENCVACAEKHYLDTGDKNTCKRSYIF